MPDNRPQPKGIFGVRAVVNRRLAGVLVTVLAVIFVAAGTAAFADTFGGTSDADHLTGSPTPAQFYGEDGDDTLDGLGGNDYLEGGPGNDQINGGLDRVTLPR